MSKLDLMYIHNYEIKIHQIEMLEYHRSEMKISATGTMLTYLGAMLHIGIRAGTAHHFLALCISQCRHSLISRH